MKGTSSWESLADLSGDENFRDLGMDFATSLPLLVFFLSKDCCVPRKLFKILFNFYLLQEAFLERSRSLKLSLV